MKKKNEIVKTIFKNVFYVIIIIAMLYNICYFLNTTITNKNYFKTLGITLINANSDNMEPEINKNDLIIVKECKQQYNNDDIIAYILNGQIRISKIKNVNVDNGKISYIVKANNNYYPDIEPVVEEQIIGNVVYNIFTLGILIKILQTKTLTIVIFIILIFMFLYNRYAYLKSIERRRKKKKIRPGN